MVGGMKYSSAGILAKDQNYLHEQMQKNAVPDNHPGTAVLFSKIVVLILAASHGEDRLSDQIGKLPSKHLCTTLDHFS